jgi:2-oxo-4-hydroxy-4-carboxy-5-ureidoimidazoline decarboxylase
VTLDELNALSADHAVRELLRCCGSTRWATAVAAHRPFASVQAVLTAADDVWSRMEGSDWLEAFGHHPRIGERAGGWAGQEQSGMRDADDSVARRLADRNREYERKFHHVFLICATGKSANEMLETIERRLSNEPATELKVAAGEQAKITRLRLEKLLAPSLESSRTG